ncbi:SLC13 family permease [Corynebacterium sp.]|uniref:SLC13 family permease n=1 Tax=Corynebacterium sp. TaxID=1720 RepID=UPI003734FA86
MTVELVTALVLAVIFVVGTVRHINIGILGMIGAFFVGLYVYPVNEALDEVFGQFPVGLAFSLIGLTFLFGFAQINGTIDIIVGWAMRLTRGKRWIMPWIFFFLTGFFMGIGAVFAVGVISPIAMPFAKKYKIDPLLMGMMVIHGGTIAVLSPLSVYGVFVNEALEANGFIGYAGEMFALNFIFCLAFGVLVFFLLGGRELIKDKGNTATEYTPVKDVTANQWLTMACIAVLIVAAGFYNLDIGAVSLILGGVLALAKPADSKRALDGVAWSTIILIGGMVTYIAVLQDAGTVDWIAGGIASLGAASVGLLLLAYLCGIVSALASSIATLGIAMSMIMPLLAAGDIPVAAAAAVLAISTTIVDVSPFSTSGALVLANVPRGDYDAQFRAMMRYAGLIVAIAPVSVWLMTFIPV